MEGFSLRLRMTRLICAMTLVCLLASALPTAVFGARAESQYYIAVDVTNQVVTVYDNGNISDSGIVRQMICSTGKNATPTPLGTYSLPTKTHSSERREWYYFSQYNCYAKWATRIVGGILFHSVLFTASKSGPTKASTKALGSQASHGCIRLRIEDAKWIAENCRGGTTCKIFKSGTKDKDLRKRLSSRTFSRDEMTYDVYMGRAGGAALAQAGVIAIKLSRGSKGEAVLLLQNRLRGLGYMNDVPDGKFGKTTKTAVKAFQAVCGLKKSGKVDTDLWNRLFADNAPTATLATLVEGWQGPAVAVLQQALADLRLFGGAVDGNYAAGTTDAVRLFQQCYGYPATGAADPALQQEVIARAQALKAQFGQAAYQMVADTHEAMFATVIAKRYTRMRDRASSGGKKLAKLYTGTQVKLLADDGGEWVQVQYGTLIGYVLRKSMSFFTGTETTLSYTAVTEPAPVAEDAAATGELVVLAAPMYGAEDEMPIQAPEWPADVSAVEPAETAVAEAPAELAEGQAIVYGDEPVASIEEGTYFENGLEIEVEQPCE